MKKFLSLLAAAFFLCSMLWSQEDEISPPAAAENNQTVYVIRNLDFDINGRTRAFAIIYNGEFKAGERIEGQAALDRYIARKTQILLNQRVLQNASIDYTLGTPDADGSVPVDLLIHTVDSWNVIALPYPKFDNNSGLSITIKARDYNFFGTMVPLRVDLGYHNDIGSHDDDNAKNKTSYTFAIDSDIPFRAVGYDWNFNFDHDFSYTDGDPLYYKNTTGISMEMPFRTTLFTFGFNEYFIVHEEISDSDKAEYGLTDDFSGPYAASELYTSWRIPLGIKVGEWGDLNYTPRLATLISYPKGGFDQLHKPVGNFSHSIGFGSFDWIGNYREGLSASIGNGYSINILPYNWSSSINISTAYYHTFSKLFGVSTKLEYRQWFNTVYEEAGGALRGIKDNRIDVKRMLSFNIDFPFRIVHFYPSEWYHDRRFRVIDFDLHISPFFDMALFEGPYDNFKPNNAGADFNFDDALYTGGVEVIIFPAFMRSLYLRASVGYNLKSAYETHKIPKWDEIFIGMGHHY